jgi:hypothetical protein
MANFLMRSLPLVEPLKPGEAAQRGTTLYIISVVMVVVAGLFVAARISVRLSKLTTSQGLGRDDYCVIAALVILLGDLPLSELIGIPDLIGWTVCYRDRSNRTWLWKSSGWSYKASNP